MTLGYANLQITDTYRSWFNRTNEIASTAYPRVGGTINGALVVTGNTSLLQNLTVANNFTTNTIVANSITSRSIRADLTGNTFGTHTGNVVAVTVFSRDLSGNTFGIHTGSVVGNVVGNLTGNVNATSVVAANVNSTSIVTSTISSNTGVYTGEVSALDFNSTSDAAFKQDIETITDASCIVNQLRGVSFKWKETNQPSYGVVAQELENVVPNLVSVNKDGSKSVRYNGLIGFLVESNKQLQQQLDALSKKIDELIEKDNSGA